MLGEHRPAGALPKGRSESWQHPLLADSKWCSESEFNSTLTVQTHISPTLPQLDFSALSLDRLRLQPPNFEGATIPGGVLSVTFSAEDCRVGVQAKISGQVPHTLEGAFRRKPCLAMAGGRVRHREVDTRPHAACCRAAGGAGAANLDHVMSGVRIRLRPALLPAISRKAPLVRIVSACSLLDQAEGSYQSRYAAKTSEMCSLVVGEPSSLCLCFSQASADVASSTVDARLPRCISPGGRPTLRLGRKKVLRLLRSEHRGWTGSSVPPPACASSSCSVSNTD